MDRPKPYAHTPLHHLGPNLAGKNKWPYCAEVGAQCSHWSGIIWDEGLKSEESSMIWYLGNEVFTYSYANNFIIFSMELECQSFI